MVKYPFWVAYTNYYIIRYNMRVAAIRVVNTRVLGYPGPVWPTQVPTWVPWNQRSAQLPRSPSSKHWLPVWPHTGKLAAAENAKRPVLVDNYRTRSTLAGADTVHAFIYVCRVGFVKWHKWCIACNRPTLACPRKIDVAIAFEVALQVASVARSVFMTSQLYRRLSALSVLSRYCWFTRDCRLPPAIRYDTILMLFRSTSPLGDRASPPQVRLSVGDLSPPSSPGFTAELNGPYVLRRIRTMCRRFGDQSAGGSVLSPSQLDRARTRDWVGPGIISGT